MLTTEEATRFYDRFGSKQDSQGFYEDQAIDLMLEKSDLQNASFVFEFGCGTGRMAETMLTRYLSSSAQYSGIDVSSTMISLARDRLSRFGDRASLRRSDGSTAMDAGPNTFDRFVSTYVLDLLPSASADALVGEAHRVLQPSGLMCLVGITTGFTPVTRCVSNCWSFIHRVRPVIVGGCRPTRIENFFSHDIWDIKFTERVAPWGIPSEIVIAQKRSHT